MNSHRPRYQRLHPDRSVCSKDHRYSSSGKPLTDGCPGRIGFTVTCTGCGFKGEALLKVVAENSFRSHLGRAHKA